MILISHIIIALVSVILSTLSYVKPSQLKLKISYAFISLTVASGSYLILALNASMLHVCTMGLLFCGYSLTSVVLAKRKLARQEADI